MKPYQQDFIEFCLKYKVLRFGEFKLKSGRMSPYFFNSGLFDTGKAISQLGRYYAEAIIDQGFDYNVLFGPAYKGIPLVTAVAIGLATQFDQDKPYCFNRKEAKDHGEGGNIVGAPLTGKVLVVDDVITAGTAVREAVKIIETSGAKLNGIMVALDRCERGEYELSAIQEIEQQYKIKIGSIICLDNLVEYLANNKDYKQHLKTLEVYQDQYGAKK